MLQCGQILNVKDYGAVGDGIVLDTAAVQDAIEACAARGGGRVVFPYGDFVLGTVYLRSHVHLVIEKGARILGAPSFYDFAPEEKVDYPLYQDSSHSNFNCSLFVGRDCEDVVITGGGAIDMRSVWDEDDVRKIFHRGPKCIALRECRHVEISRLAIENATDLAVYFAGCEDVDIYELMLRVYIDGISPDNSKNVRIHDCDIEAGDDGIVFKSSYTLNRLDICEDIRVWNCRIKCRTNGIKFGTETNGGFERIDIRDIDMREVRISGIAIESVDGAVIDGVSIKNVKMRNVASPLFVHLGTRMRGPAGREIGAIRNITLENIKAEGPYVPYDIIPWCYVAYKSGNSRQEPWNWGPMVDGSEIVNADPRGPWQITSNICGLRERPLQNITLRNVHLTLAGGATEYEREVPEEPQNYTEVFVYGQQLPAKGIYFRHVEGLVLDNVTVETYRPDTRDAFVMDDVTLA